MRHFEGALSGLTQFLSDERPIKMMETAFYFTLKALSVVLTIWSCRKTARLERLG